MSHQTGRKPKPTPQPMDYQWSKRGACRPLNPELFFPGKGQSARLAKKVCDKVCPVKAECLEWALAQPVRVEGVWGGTTEKDRRELRRAQPQPKPLKPIQHGTERGARNHIQRGEKPCPSCERARRAAKNMRSNRRTTYDHCCPVCNRPVANAKGRIPPHYDTTWTTRCRASGEPFTITKAAA